MLQQRPYTPHELLAWCRLLAVSLAGSAMAYAREREGSCDGLLEFWRERLAGLSLDAPGDRIEPALLGLQLNLEAIGGKITSRAVNPEGAELVVSSLPGERLMQDLEDRFEVSLAEADLLAGLGVTSEELNRLLDVFGHAAARASFEYQRESEGDTQRLNLRVW